MAYLLGWTSAVLVGLSKTGVPGVSIPAVVLMTEAFPDNVKLSVGALLPVLLVGDLFAVAWYRHHAQWGRLVRLLPYVVLGMVPGWLLLRASEGNELRPVIGGLVLLLLGVEVCRRRFDWEHMPSRWWFTGIMGSLAGFSTLVANAAMPVMSIYLVSQGMHKQQFIGTAAWFFLILNLSKIPLYASAGMMTAGTLRFDLIAAPGALVGAVLGVYVLTRIPQRSFDALALGLAGIAAVRLVLV